MENYEKLETYLKNLYPDKYANQTIVNGKWVKVRNTKRTAIIKPDGTAIITEETEEKTHEIKPHKARKISPGARSEALQRDNYTCQKCGRRDNLQVHHIKHRADGGSDDLGNLITLCSACHAEEHKEEPIYKLMVSRFNE